MAVFCVITETRYRIWGFTIDSGHLKALAVGPHAVGVDSEEESGTIGQHAVQFLTGWTFRPEHVDAPAKSAYGTNRIFLGVLGDSCQRRLFGRNLQIHTTTQKGTEERVDMTFDEAGHQ
ncbi:Uncharacterised protein [Mycobacteroides abscessus subsp. abscessus]|nr:Uncharacterised protein [Mycobacteroides abscessus subsp. abscessus]